MIIKSWDQQVWLHEESSNQNNYWVRILKVETSCTVAQSKHNEGPRDQVLELLQREFVMATKHGQQLVCL
jgi:hypothetical protein